jgi:PAS domain S-box-containing protein
MAESPSYEALKKKIASLAQENHELRLMLKEKDTYRTNLLAKAPNPVLVINPDRTIRFVNQAFETLTGFSANEIVGLKDPFPWWTEETRHKTQADFEKAVVHGIEKAEERFRKKSGEVFTAEVSLKPIYEGKRLTCYLSNWVDISDRKETERSLVDSEQKWRHILVRTPQIGVSLDRRGRIIFANKHLLTLTGWREEEVIGRDWFDTFLPESGRDEVRNIFDTVMSQKDTSGFSNYENEIVARDGELLNVAWSNVLTKDVRGNVVDVTCLGVDLTERRRSEEALKKSEAHMKSIFSAAPTGIGVIENRVFLQVNEKFCEMTGYSQDELLGRSSRLIYPSNEEFEKVGREKYAQIRKRGTGTVETVFRRKDGELINVRLSSTPIDLNDLSAGVTFTALDITDIKKTTAALEKSELQYRTMMETIKDPVYICSEDYRVQYMNHAMIERIGEDGTGEFCYKALHDFDEKCPWCRKEKILQGESSIKDIVSPKDKRSFSVSSTILNKDDGSRSSISVLRDTTDFKRLQERLQQAQKMESIGNVAGGIAHDFNNILFPILGLSELLLEDLSPQSMEYRNVQQILKSGERGRALINQILAFSRQSEHQMVPVRVQQVVGEALTLCRSTIPANIEISQSIQGSCGFVMADPTQLHQITMNLMTNAYHAVEQQGGGISVRLEDRALASSDLKALSLKPGKYVVLSVSDTGHGIAPSVMDKIFDPYFTTKQKDKGTGLGLSVVFGIVKEHGGEIEVRSEVEKGTTFNVYLPLLKDTTETVRVEKTQIQPRGTERILLVDDEAPVLRLEKMILERLGYRVEVRDNAIGALGAFGADPKSFDLVITDMAMPKMTGDQLVEQLMAIRPDIPVILITGFSDRMNGEKAKRIGIKGFLHKPVKKSDLANLVRKLLDEAKTGA